MTFSRDIAARTLWAEARGEPVDGQRAVAHVMVNRVKDGRWGPNLGSVCLAPLQFSCWNSRDPNRLSMAKLPDDDQALMKLAALINAAATGQTQDPTGGATHYYNPDSVAEPEWAKPPSVFAGKFGHHLFFKNVA
jgi:spore germination cell wall hydrolase CwlJ-like protein